MTGGTAMQGSVAQRWVDDLWDVLVGLKALRELGAPGADAIAAVMALPPVRRLHVAWDLAMAIAEQEERDGRQAMLELLGSRRVRLVESAILGLGSPLTLCQTR